MNTLDDISHMTRKGKSPRRESKRRGSKNERAGVDERRWKRHELYGAVPLIRHVTVTANGQTYEWWQYDPTYKPRLPRGAVAGDVTKQVFCPTCHSPKYFYVDEVRRCVQCGDRFTFSGAEQKFWYEVRKFNFRSLPVRCPRCRRLRRTEHALREQIAQSKRAARESPSDPSAHLAVARAIVEYHERTGAGRLDDAIAAARKAVKLWPEAPDAVLWEGIAHARAGRPNQARACLSRFLVRPSRAEAGLEAKARMYLPQTTG